MIDTLAADRARLILASTSPYRRELLARLRLPFACVAPAVDEARLDGEAPAAMAHRFHGETDAVPSTQRIELFTDAVFAILIGPERAAKVARPTLLLWGVGTVLAEDAQQKGKETVDKGKQLGQKGYQLLRQQVNKLSD